MPLEYGGGYDSDGGMVINRGRPLDQQESTALHETQHAIQDREGFARGGSDADFLNDMERQAHSRR